MSDLQHIAKDIRDAVAAATFNEVGPATEITRRTMVLASPGHFRFSIAGDGEEFIVTIQRKDPRDHQPGEPFSAQD